MDYLLDHSLTRNNDPLPNLNYSGTNYPMIYPPADLSSFPMGPTTSLATMQARMECGTRMVSNNKNAVDSLQFASDNFGHRDINEFSVVESNPSNTCLKRSDKKPQRRGGGRQNDSIYLPNTPPSNTGIPTSSAINTATSVSKTHSGCDTEAEPKQPKKRGPKKKPLTKEREVRLKNRRVRANARERSRMHGLNHALELLRRHVPTFSASQRLSKIETLRLAKNYIRSLSELLTRTEPPTHLELAYTLTEGLSQNTSNLIATTLQVSPRALIQLQRQNATDVAKGSSMAWSPSPSLSPGASSTTSRLTIDPSTSGSRQGSYGELSSQPCDLHNNIPTTTGSPRIPPEEPLALATDTELLYTNSYPHIRSSDSTRYPLPTRFSPPTSVISDTSRQYGSVYFNSMPYMTDSTVAFCPTSTNMIPASSSSSASASVSFGTVSFPELMVGGSAYPADLSYESHGSHNPYNYAQPFATTVTGYLSNIR